MTGGFTAELLSFETGAPGFAKADVAALDLAPAAATAAELADGTLVLVGMAGFSVGALTVAGEIAGVVLFAVGSGVSPQAAGLLFIAFPNGLWPGVGCVIVNEEACGPPVGAAFPGICAGVVTGPNTLPFVGWVLGEVWLLASTCCGGRLDGLFAGFWPGAGLVPSAVEFGLAPPPKPAGLPDIPVGEIGEAEPGE